ncbi:MFS transporter [Mesoplasma seiffertii]|uniref:MFS transporter n=1 Tax=Mesoplasma seiffertii TaxID=28224 RepID=UPI00047D5E50|nr:MFS transporter [Mesoplasma seiffertii]
MNIKTYTFVKYLATVASIFLLIAPLTVFVQLWKGIFAQQSTAITISIILVVLGVIALGIYIGLRNYLKDKSGYSYQQKDKQKLWISFGNYSISALLAVTLVIIELTASKQAGMISFYVMYPLIFISMILGAIFESLSRINEQIFLYQKEYLAAQEVKQAKVKKLINQQSDAEKLLAKSPPKNHKQSDLEVNEFVKPSGSDKNPFLDEELNQKLKEQEDLEQWLNKEER